MISLNMVENREATPPMAADEKMRRCLVTGETWPVGRLLRFVAGPDGRILADVDGRLPGRGLWVGAERGLVDRAVAKRMFARAARHAVTADPGLADRVADSLAARALGILGIGRRAGAVVFGYEKVRSAVTAGGAYVLLTATDAGDGTKAPAEHGGAMRAGPVRVDCFDARELGAVLGRDRVVHVAILDAGLAKKFLREVGRLGGFRNTDPKYTPAAKGASASDTGDTPIPAIQ